MVTKFWVPVSNVAMSPLTMDLKSLWHSNLKKKTNLFVLSGTLLFLNSIALFLPDSCTLSGSSTWPSCTLILKHSLILSLTLLLINGHACLLIWGRAVLFLTDLLSSIIKSFEINVWKYNITQIAVENWCVLKSNDY